MSWLTRLKREPEAPLPEGAGETGLRLGRGNRRLLAQLAAGRRVDLLVRTGTTVDVGEWFRRGRICGMWLDGAWVMFAAGKRPFVATVAAASLGGSLYNHMVGALVLAPAPDVQVRELTMTPLEASRVLRRFGAVKGPVKKE